MTIRKASSSQELDQKEHPYRWDRHHCQPRRTKRYTKHEQHLLPYGMLLGLRRNFDEELSSCQPNHTLVGNSKECFVRAT